MKKLIEVKEISLATSDLYISSKYPSPGVYIVNGDTLVAVYSMSGGSAPCCCQLGPLIANQSMFIQKSDEMTPVGVDKDVFLKTVALILNPDLGAKLFD